MAEPIFMRIGSGNSLELPELVGAIGNFLGLLKEVDSAVAERKTGNLKWHVTTLEKSPSPLIGVTPMLRRKASDTGDWVERELIGSVTALTERGERNKYLSDAALTRVENIAKTSNKIGPSTIYTTISKSLKLTTSVSIKTLEQVKDMTGVTSTSFGAVRGKLDTISVRRGLEFRIWDETSQRPVRCKIDPKMRKHALDILGNAAIVTGIIFADRQGRPVSMDVETFDSFTYPNDLPTIEEMRGFIPDFTGGLSLKEFLEDMD